MSNQLTTANYFDIQVNGYGGVDFNQDDLNEYDLDRACRKLTEDGVSEILATFITDDIGVMCSRIKNFARARAASSYASKVIAGIHIEGPFISPEPGFRGAHPLDAIRPANWTAMQALLEAAGGLTRLVTLAPEHDPGYQVIKKLVHMGIRVSAGHCDPSLDQLKAAIDSGVTLFTHLGNGCPMQMHRHDNIIQRVVSLSDRIWICLIADGVHVPYPALTNILRAAGIERCIIVTDAIAPAGLGPGLYTLSRWKLLIGDDMVARAPDGSHFVGSAITMPQAARNLAENCKVTSEQIEKLTWYNPRLALGLPTDKALTTERLALSK